MEVTESQGVEFMMELHYGSANVGEASMDVVLYGLSHLCESVSG